MLGQAVRAYCTQQLQPPVPKSTPKHEDIRTWRTENSASSDSSTSHTGRLDRMLDRDASLKRKANSSLQEAPLSKVNRSSEDLGVPNKLQGSVLNKLHGGVFFDENDFVDDADIDLDEESPLPPAPAVVPLPKALRTPTPKSSAPSAVKYPTIPTSQVEWSSSPVEHYRAPLEAAGPSAPIIKPTEAPIVVDSSPDEPVRPARRRQLPWQNKPARPPPQVLNATNLESNATKSQGAKQDAVSYPSLPAMTPVSKARPDTSYLWDKTASAMKEEQRKFRQQANQGRKQTKEPAEAPPVEDASHPVISRVKSSQKGTSPVFLSNEQRSVLDLITTGKKSVFFTGSAGTGKSVLMREIIHVLKRNNSRDPDRVAVTASTGLAACNIGGVTLHSYSGIGLGKESVELLVKKIKKNPKARQRWLRTKVLIIDEISMVDGDLFDKLEEVARIIRNNGRPFGGIQLVITGDFFQLPPVPDRGKVAKFAFDAATWSTSIQHTIGLTHVFRQKDPEFASMLNEMRLGKLSDRSIACFRSLSREPPLKDDIEPTELFPTRQEVDRANEARMRGLTGNCHDFAAIDGGSMQDINRRTELLQNCMAPEKLTLKIGAQVMLIKNMQDTLVNGTIGKVVGFMDETSYDYEMEHGDPSIHNASEYIGEGTTGSKFAPNKFRNASVNTSTKYPVVQFQLPDGTLRELLCQRESWKVEQPNGEVVASRSQVPLIPAWALSIHKAQGQTLDRVRVDLGRIFEKGQAYVALSRATTQDGLQVKRFDPKKVMAHEKVRKFYDSLACVTAPPTAASATRTAAPSLAPDDHLFLGDHDDESFVDDYM